MLPSLGRPWHIAGAVLFLEGRDREFELGRDLGALDRAQASSTAITSSAASTPK
jgi:hypothetical protein